MPRFGIDPADHADHFRIEEDVFEGDHPGQEIDSRLVRDPGVEIDVVEQELVQGRAAHILGEPAIWLSRYSLSSLGAVV